MTWTLYYTKQAQKDARKLAASGLKDNAQELLRVPENDPYQNPPPYEKLVGDLAGAYPRRINIQHRLVYQALEKGKRPVTFLAAPLSPNHVPSKMNRQNCSRSSLH